jgi:hypothetical protein
MRKATLGDRQLKRVVSGLERRRSETRALVVTGKVDKIKKTQWVQLAMALLPSDDSVYMLNA